VGNGGGEITRSAERRERLEDVVLRMCIWWGKLCWMRSGCCGACHARYCAGGAEGPWEKRRIGLGEMRQVWISVECWYCRRPGADQITRRPFGMSRPGGHDKDARPRIRGRRVVWRL